MNWRAIVLGREILPARVMLIDGKRTVTDSANVDQRNLHRKALKKKDIFFTPSIFSIKISDQPISAVLPECHRYCLLIDPLSTTIVFITIALHRSVTRCDLYGAGWGQYLSALDTKVETNNGVVTLRGNAKNAAEKGPGRQTCERHSRGEECQK